MSDYACVHGHDACHTMYPGPQCPYCERRRETKGGRDMTLTAHTLRGYLARSKLRRQRWPTVREVAIRFNKTQDAVLSTVASATDVLLCAGFTDYHRRGARQLAIKGFDPVAFYRDDAAERFAKMYKIDPATGCWIWQRGRCPKGYGAFNWNGSIRAHRASYLLHRGEIGPHLHVCHTCDTPACVNPDHLFLGTNEENFADSVRKGRRVFPRGEEHGCARLTAEDVEAIRSRYPGQSQYLLAREFGVSQAQIWRIINEHSWRSA